MRDKKMQQAQRVHPAWLRWQATLLLVPALALPGCSVVRSTKAALFGGNQGQALSGFIGGAVADEPTAALAARDVLAHGGNAADAAVAAGMMLAVTLPSRASLGASGACLAYTPGESAPEAILFTPRPGGPGGDRLAAIPMMARGLYLLNVRYGSRSFASLVAPAQTAASQGIPASRALVDDLTDVAAPLMQDPGAAAVFAPNGHLVTVGSTIVQPDLAAWLGKLRENGVGDMYSGVLATTLTNAIQSAGGGSIAPATLRDALPRLAAPITLPQGDYTIAFLPAPADGGLAAAAAALVLQQSPDAYAAAKQRALAAAAASRAGDTQTMTLLTDPPPAPPLPELPASTSLVVVDNKGGAVGCAFTMNNLFGTGRIAPGTGIVLGASPVHKPTPLLAAAIAWNPRTQAFRAVAAGTGQDGAPVAVASAITAAVSGNKNISIPEPGRINLAACDKDLPGDSSSCHFAADPRGSGLATVSD